MQLLAQKSSRRILGLMSGTSCDGLDLALVKITGVGRKTKIDFKTGQTKFYMADQKQFLLNSIQSTHTTLQHVSQLNFYLARLWADQIHLFMQDNKLAVSDVDLIASHGQTLWHEPQPSLFADLRVASTLQLGDPAVLAQLTGIPVMGDFRVADVALGGQGAPLIPFFDWVYFSRFEKNLLVLNIGGISNLTLVPGNGALNDVQAFDCGPGNMLIDLACRRFFDLPFDRAGELAAGGKPDLKLLQAIEQKDLFSQQPPPKSTGREFYGSAFLDSLPLTTDPSRRQKYDILHTLTLYTARSIAQNYKQFVLPTQVADMVAVGGGGAKNAFLMSLLEKKFAPIPVRTVRSFGIDEDFKEAIGFAVLANETIHHRVSNVPQTTGASRAAILGKYCPV